jgi:hypothetical protein
LLWGHLHRHLPDKRFAVRAVHFQDVGHVNNDRLVEDCSYKNCTRKSNRANGREYCVCGGTRNTRSQIQVTDNFNEANDHRVKKESFEISRCWERRVRWGVFRISISLEILLPAYSAPVPRPRPEWVCASRSRIPSTAVL